ncbi:conserved hypothetical protein [Culex quinquefasciatus]|uniref:Corticotropin-releasing factor binding protein N-terminal domain-containing protein n=2 Tax=Culex quinquefasciatus TaxID=7176 RepID=B0W7H8_CULQU|nr:conserved hypothetical protein [Culex quinquefasciatus]|eukprot:XP_001844662.1 conserved hypothetical protein [Culex quinquefasciatus]
MKGVLILCFHVLVLSFQAKAWHAVRNPFEFVKPPEKIHPVTVSLNININQSLRSTQMITIMDWMGSERGHRVNFCVGFFVSRAWHAVRNPFEFVKPPEKIHPVTDCMQVTSEDGEFVFRKVAPVVSAPKHGRLIDILGSAPSMEVCGLYFVTDPDKIVEVSVKHLDVNCDTGGLMSFVDGWELNGMYFPTEQDHPKGMEQRVEEFCNDPKLWPYSPVRKAFRSSQNAALVQYRIPISGSFVVSVRYLRNPDPCNVMAEGVAPYYTLRNHGKHRNCTLTAVFPAVISLVGIDVGGRKDGVNYDVSRVRY